MFGVKGYVLINQNPFRYPLKRMNGGGIDHPLDAALTGSLQDIAGSIHVHPADCFIGTGHDGDHACKMVNQVDSLHGFPEGCHIQDITLCFFNIQPLDGSTIFVGEQEHANMFPAN